MDKVLIYSFEGAFSGDPEYRYAEPESGAVHRCILFLRQEQEQCDFSFAKAECQKFGFRDVANLKGNSLSVESLNSDGGRKFVPFYEEAMAEGSSLVWYPNG